jgi:hypothetical protein
MPNIGYTLDGYDIFYGNPMATGKEELSGGTVE